MTTPDIYILPEEVHLVPVDQLTEQMKSKFEYEETDFILTNSGARNTSKVIDASSALLLQEFRKPKSIPEGILTYSVLNKLNPEQALESAYKFLIKLRSEGFLIHFDEMSASGKKNPLKAGDLFTAYEIISKLPGVTDTEVYKVKKDNSFFALKILKTNTTNPALADHFHNEIRILKNLDGAVNPEFIEAGEYESGKFLITEWIEGVSCVKAAEKYSNLNDPMNLLSIINLCCEILNAYRHLHLQGVIHSDIHPGNILVTTTGAVKIIDFGLSRISSDGGKQLRGGQNFYYEPEYAEAIINSTRPPQSTYAGEQYAIAALIYQLITGKQYLQFSFDHDTLYKQIANDNPVTFDSLDIELDPRIEKTILKALSKKPTDRYSSIDEFYNKFSGIKENVKQCLDNNAKKSFEVLCDSLKERYGYAGHLIEKGLQLAPRSSVNFGTAGIAYMFNRMGIIDSDPVYLSLADIWADRATDYIHDKENSFYSKEIDITPATVGTTSIYHTSSGVHLVQGLISKEAGNYTSYQTAVQNFITASSQPCENLDLTLGKSSTLIGCSLLLENFLSSEIQIKKELLKLGNTTMNSIWSVIDTYAAIAEKTPINYRGIAHGWAGILYATLKWCIVAGQALPVHFLERVTQLEKLGIEEDHLMRWNISNTEYVSWTGWCHGSAGYVFLWTLLFRYTNNPKYLLIAEMTANHFLKAANPGNNGSLCCGMAGECYSLLNIYKVTGNEFYLSEANRISKRMLPYVYSNQMRNNSLYKGDIGVGVLLSEIKKPAFTKMPLFE